MNNGQFNNNNKNNNYNVLPVLAYYLIEKMEYVTIDEIYEAYYDCRKKKRRKRSAVEFELHYEEYLRRLHEELNAQTYEIQPSIVFCVTRPKHREVFAADFRDRVVHHLLMIKLQPILEGEMIDNSFNCRRGKGTDYGVRTMQRQIREVSSGYKERTYVLQCDLQGFFMSINKDMLWEKLETVIRNKWHYGNIDWWLWLTEKIVKNRPEKNCIINGRKDLLDALPDNKTLFRSNGTGLPIGNLTSQIFGNYYLTEFDRWMLGKIGTEARYGRYVDDFYVVGRDKKKLLSIIPEIREYLSDNMGLTLHPKKVTLTDVRQGVKFIGSVIMPWGLYIGNRTVTHTMEVAKMTKVKNYHSYVQRLNSYFGFMQGRLTYTIRRNVWDTIPTQIKKNIVCINMRKFRARSSYRQTRAVV